MILRDDVTLGLAVSYDIHITKTFQVQSQWYSFKNREDPGKSGSLLGKAGRGKRARPVLSIETYCLRFVFPSPYTLLFESEVLRFVYFIPLPDGCISLHSYRDGLFVGHWSFAYYSDMKYSEIV